jgi:hypothetical protein
MNGTRWFVAGVVAVGLAVAALPMVFLKKIEIIAEERLDLLAGIDQRAQTIGYLASGSRAWVVGCEDIHHYVVIKVRFDSDKTGYVHKGKFRLIRPSASSAWSAPVASGCEPLP